MPDTPVRKFMFERSFDDAVAPGHGPVRERRPATYSHEQMEAAKKEAQEAGFAAGRKSASEEQAQHLNVILTQLATHVGRLIANAEAEKPTHEAQLREAVLAIARKVLPDYCQRNGLQEIQAVVTGVIAEMAGEPRLVVRVNESQFDTINESVKNLTEQHGFAGKIVLLADADVPTDDCRIEWADGGVERNLQALWQSIGQALAPGKELPPISSPPAAESPPSVPVEDPTQEQAQPPAEAVPETAVMKEDTNG